jgi:signal transduction histidine kinase
MDPNISALPNPPRPGTLPELQDEAAPADTQALIARVDQLSREAFHLRESEQWDDMLTMAEEARELAETIDYRAGIARAVAVRAFVRYMRSDFQAAINDCMDAIEMSAGQDAEGEGKALATLAMVNWTLGNYEEALRHGDRAMELIHASGDEITYGFGFLVKAGILQSLEQYPEALKWGQRGIEAFSKLDHAVGRARSLAVVGSVHLALGHYDEALAHHRQSLEIAKSIHHRFTVSRALSDLGAAWEALKDDDQALHFHSEALAIRELDGHRLAATTSLLALGRIYRRRGDAQEAVELLRRALSIVEELGARPRAQQVHELLAQLYEDTGELALALKHFKASSALKNELAGDRILLRYRTLALEAEIGILQSQAELEKMAALGKLVAALAHEINSPLGAIRGSADVTARCVEKLSAAHDSRLVDILRSNAQTISDASARIADLVARLKSFAGIDQAPYTQLDVKIAIDGTLALLRPEFDKRVAVQMEFDCEPKLYVYAAELQQVFMNLLRNAVEAIEGPGTVRIRLYREDGSYKIAFVDSGRGIEPDQISQLFTPNFRAGGSRVKASLSLFTCMNIVKQHGGTILVESQPGQGSTFIVALPERLDRTDPALEARR